MLQRNFKNLFFGALFTMSLFAYTYLNSNFIPTTTNSTTKIENKDQSTTNVLPDVQIFIYVVNKVKEVVYLPR